MQDCLGKQHGFVIIDLCSKNTTVCIEVGLTILQTKLNLKSKLLFSLYKMENLLKQIVSNTEPKRSFSILVSDNKTRFKIWFKPPLQLDKKIDYERALINRETYYSFPNIDRSNNCFSYSPSASGSWFNIIIPEGSYHVKDINEFIHRQMR